jgi:predicted nucleic acid-binding protein
MIYVDTSVVLAELLAEDRRPSDELWNQTLVSSRLLEYELWSRVYGRGLASSHGEAARALVGRLALVEMVSPILVRALEPFPVAVRTLDALHLASAEFLRERQPALRLATYDVRQAAAAEALGIGLYDLDSGTRDATPRGAKHTRKRR